MVALCWFARAVCFAQGLTGLVGDQRTPVVSYQDRMDLFMDRALDCRRCYGRIFTSYSTWAQFAATMPLSGTHVADSNVSLMYSKN